MDGGKLHAVDDYFKHTVWFEDFGGDVRVHSISIKVDGGGILAVLKGVSAEGPKVTFRQASSFEGLYRDLQRLGKDRDARWRDDKYKLDRK